MNYDVEITPEQRREIVKEAQRLGRTWGIPATDRSDKQSYDQALILAAYAAGCARQRDGAPAVSVIECVCELHDVSTTTEIRFVRGFSRGCQLHPPSIWEIEAAAREARRQAEIVAAQKHAEEAP